MIESPAARQCDACSEVQVVYPALDAKVKNVTLAYSVEHEDEVGGLLHLIHLAQPSCNSCRSDAF